MLSISAGEEKMNANTNAPAVTSSNYSAIPSLTTNSTTSGAPELTYPGLTVAAVATTS